MNNYERAAAAMELLSAVKDGDYHAYVNCHPEFVRRNPGGFAAIPDVETWMTEPPFQVCPERLLEVTADLTDMEFIRFCGAVRRLMRATIIDTTLLPPDLVFAKFEQERPDDALRLREVAAKHPFPVEQFLGLDGRSNHGVVTTSERQLFITKRLYEFCTTDPRMFGVALSRATWPVERLQDALGWAPPTLLDASEPTQYRFAFCPELIDETTAWLRGSDDHGDDLLPDYLDVVEVFVSGYLCKPGEDPGEVQRYIESYLYEEAPDHLRLLSEVEGKLLDASQH
jgi:hypothetical protein